VALVIEMTVDERWSVFEIECKYFFVLLHCMKYFYALSLCILTETAQIFTQQAYTARFNKRRVSNKRRGF